ncbi:hypothetical protein FB45DRAFT_1141826 [Roridomyces roridus]|uniref:Uncharacterized protein n=1 Tax=Roridomyces roridus TaxID=1738132 RepID=A0AAD7BYW5_9AGAR|nr:hypothetical protein FB45DRAFT_1141826 [Roridomyces roridus]
MRSFASCQSNNSRSTMTAGLQSSERKSDTLDVDSQLAGKWVNVRRIAPTALLLVHWTAVSAASLAFHFVVREFVQRRIEASNRDKMNGVLNTLIVGFVYCGCTSALILVVLVFGARGQRVVMVQRLVTVCQYLTMGLLAWIGILSGLLSSNPLVPLSCEDQNVCFAHAVAHPVWTRAVVVVWVVLSTLFVHSLLWAWVFNNIWGRFRSGS